MADEEIQELGREGVGQIREWLEATTWFYLPYNAYQDGIRCKLSHHSGRKKFDLVGHHRGDENQRRTVYVECKRYTTASGQAKEFKRFLAIAYSSAHKQVQEFGEWDGLYIWATYHPFSIGQWSQLTTADAVRAAVVDTENSDILHSGPLNEDLIRNVADQVWLLVLSDKQLNITLTPEELNAVLGVVDREGTPLWNR